MKAALIRHFLRHEVFIVACVFFSSCAGIHVTDMRGAGAITAQPPAVLRGSPGVFILEIDGRRVFSATDVLTAYRLDSDVTTTKVWIDKRSGKFDIGDYRWAKGFEILLSPGQHSIDFFRGADRSGISGQQYKFDAVSGQVYEVREWPSLIPPFVFFDITEAEFAPTTSATHPILSSIVSRFQAEGHTLSQSDLPLGISVNPLVTIDRRFVRRLMGFAIGSTELPIDRVEAACMSVFDLNGKETSRLGILLVQSSEMSDGTKAEFERSFEEREIPAVAKAFSFSADRTRMTGIVWCERGQLSATEISQYALLCRNTVEAEVHSAFPSSNNARLP